MRLIVNSLLDVAYCWPAIARAVIVIITHDERVRRNRHPSERRL